MMTNEEADNILRHNDWAKWSDARKLIQQVDADAAAQLRQENEELRRDAARYRWLRDGEWECFADSWLVNVDVYGQGPDDLDAAIDVELAKREEE
jgi:hypothetical protein